jgi:hypothetical protein
METKQLSTAQIEARRRNARRSTGPRTARGKRHSRRNARKHGLYSDVEFFFWDAAMELGEDPRQFQRLFAGLIEARRPADTLEQVLVEEIAVLIWKKARLERSEAAVQVCNVRKHDLERRKQYIQVGRDVTTLSQSEALEKGLRVAPDAPGKFERLVTMLGMLEEAAERNEFTQETLRLLQALYGEQPTLRGAGLFNTFRRLEKLPPEEQEFEDAKKLFQISVADETVDVLKEYELFLHEHVENTRAARIAAIAPSHAQWAAIIRQQNALHRQLERKIRLLDEIQERRRKRKASTLDLLSKLEALGHGPHEPEGGGQGTPASPGPSSGEEGSRCSSQPTAAGRSSADAGAAVVAAPHCLSGQSEHPQLKTVDAPAHGQPQGLPLHQAVGTPGSALKTKNRGNEAKKSLKTKEVAKTKCAKRTKNDARKAHNEAKKTAFRCRRYRPRRRSAPRTGRTPQCRWRDQPRGWLAWQGSRLGLRGLGRPSVAERIGRSQDTGFLQALIQAAMLALPIVRPDLKRLARGNSFDGQSCKFVFRALVRPHQALDILFDSNSLGLCPRAEPRFELWRNGDGHGSSTCQTPSNSTTCWLRHQPRGNRVETVPRRGHGE